MNNLTILTDFIYNTFDNWEIDKTTVPEPSVYLQVQESLLRLDSNEFKRYFIHRFIRETGTVFPEKLFEDAINIAKNIYIQESNYEGKHPYINFNVEESDLDGFYKTKQDISGWSEADENAYSKKRKIPF